MAFPYPLEPNYELMKLNIKQVQRVQIQNPEYLLLLVTLASLHHQLRGCFSCQLTPVLLFSFLLARMHPQTGLD